LWDEIGWQGVKAVMEAAIAAKYKHCDSVRLWKAKCEDEGVRLVCKFLQTSKSVNVLELLDAELTTLGCEFLSQTLHSSAEVPLLVLKLDHNPIGAAGMKALAQGLSMNKTLELVSLTYCSIDKEGANSLFEIVIYTQSGLKELNVTGNLLGDEGVVKVL
jgi:Ran GTPase-activating protein (RanGAP) involved in mRNA processing and transport